MATNNIQFPILIRKNDNMQSPAYGKYYPKAQSQATLSLRGLLERVAFGQSAYSRDMIEGMITKITEVMLEVLSQGVPVKWDGLGTFAPYTESVKSGISLADLKAGKWNANKYVKGVHIRFLPEGKKMDDITSVTFKDYCEFVTMGVEEKVNIGTDESPNYITKITPLEDWIAEHQD